jgi:hypothetical protein
MAPITTKRIKPMTGRFIPKSVGSESDFVGAVLATLSAEAGVVSNAGSSAGLVVTGIISAEVTTM